MLSIDHFIGTEIEPKDPKIEYLDPSMFWIEKPIKNVDDMKQKIIKDYKISDEWFAETLARISMKDKTLPTKKQLKNLVKKRIKKLIKNKA